MIYLDNNATTPTDTNILKAMLPYYSEDYGNPHSNTHMKGINASLAIEESRKKIANYFNAPKEGVVFTSGATESNNLAITGYIQKSIKKGIRKKKVLCSAVDHKCVLECIKAAKVYGLDPHILKVDSQGKLDLDYARRYIDEDTLIVSVMATNNETGVDLQIEELASICEKFNVFFHSDIAQSLHHKSFNIEDNNIDAMSISGHKIYGPKGIGALICKEEPALNLEPLILGGYQEAELRSGTLPTNLCIGLGEAVELLSKNKDKYFNHYKKLRDKLWTLLIKKIDGLEKNSLLIEHPGVLNLYFPNIDAEMLCMKLAKDVAISTAAACNSVNYEYSYVLREMSLSEERSRSSVRLCIGRQNTEEEILLSADFIINAYRSICINA